MPDVSRSTAWTPAVGGIPPGWWQASDGNWYPPQNTSAQVTMAPSARSAQAPITQRIDKFRSGFRAKFFATVFARRFQAYVGNLNRQGYRVTVVVKLWQWGFWGNYLVISEPIDSARY